MGAFCTKLSFNDPQVSCFPVNLSACISQYCSNFIGCPVRTGVRTGVVLLLYVCTAVVFVLSTLTFWMDIIRRPGPFRLVPSARVPQRAKESPESASLEAAKSPEPLGLSTMPAKPPQAGAVTASCELVRRIE